MDLHQAVQAIPPAFVNITQAARFLGVSTSMARKLARTDRMPVKRYGRSIRIPFSWLEAEAASAQVAPAVHQS